MQMDEYKTANGMGIHARRFLSYVVLVIISILCLFWFYVLFVNATRSHGDLTTRGFRAIPSTNLIENWKNLMAGTQPVVRGLLNSLIVASLTAALSTYFSTVTAYAIHVYRFPGRKFISSFILAIMMIPTQVSALGFVDLMRTMKLNNTFVPLIVPAIAAPAVFFYMKQYLQSALPLSIVEASRIDGASEFRTFNEIVLPIVKPAIAVQAIFSFVTSWNNYFTPALILEKDKVKTLPILIAGLRSADFLKFDMGQVYIMIAFSILPVIVVYLILSKYIVEGIALGSVKG